MKRLPMLFLLILVLHLAPRAEALDITAPLVPDSGRELMPENTESFGQGVWEILRTAIGILQPDIREAAGICMRVLAAVLLLSVMENMLQANGDIQK